MTSCGFICMEESGPVCNEEKKYEKVSSDHCYLEKSIKFCV